MARKKRSVLLRRLRFPLETAAVRVALAAIPGLPLPVVTRLARCLGDLAYRFDRRGRQTSLANLRAALGPGESPAELHRIARESYRNLAVTAFQLFWSPNLDAANYHRFAELEIVDPSSFESAKKRGAIWVTPHFSNFEWLALVGGFQVNQFCIIAEDFKNPALTPLFRQLRERSGHRVIPQESAFLRLLRHLQRGGHAALLTDLTVEPHKGATVIECFGLRTCVTRIHAVLSARLGLPVIPALCFPAGSGRYRLRVYPALLASDFPDERTLVQACWDTFEPEIRRAPHLWMWMYKHWRHLPSEHPERYPAYANHSKRFALLEEEAFPTSAHTPSGADSPSSATSSS